VGRGHAPETHVVRDLQVVRGGTRRVILHDHYNMPRNGVAAFCSCRPSTRKASYQVWQTRYRTATLDVRAAADILAAARCTPCACETVDEVVVAFTQARDLHPMAHRRGATYDMPEYVLGVARAFPRARIVLVGAECGKIGRYPRANPPIDPTHEQILTLVFAMSDFRHELAEVRERVAVYKIHEYRRMVGEDAWDAEGFSEQRVCPIVWRKSLGELDAK
jgi:hypothetical protein